MEKNQLPKDLWYECTKKHWSGIEPNISGMLGGNEVVHKTDIKTSVELLANFISKKFLKPIRCLEVGAGIGRVTEHLLQYFEKVDVIEQEPNFANKLRENLSKNPNLGEVNTIAIQNFKMQNTYNCIWIQWCIENLSDEDLAKFLNNCKSNLEKGGMIIMKENVVANGSRFCDEDFSRVRSDEIFRRIFKECNLKIFKYFKHPNWPEDLMEVAVYVLM